MKYNLGLHGQEKFAFEHYSFTPDIVVCAKGMGSGIPISGVVSSKKLLVQIMLFYLPHNSETLFLAQQALLL